MTNNVDAYRMAANYVDSLPTAEVERLLVVYNFESDVQLVSYLADLYTEMGVNQ